MLDVLRERPVWAVCLLALALRAGWSLTLPQTVIWRDEKEFVEVARHLQLGEGYVSPTVRANPVLPVFLAVIFRVFGENYLIARLAQSILGAASCGLLYWIGARLFSRAAGVAAALLLAIYPPHLYLAGVFYVDCIQVFLCLLAVASAIRTMETPSLFTGFLSGILLGLTVLTRPAYAIWVPCFGVVWFFCSLPGQRKRWAVSALGLGLGCVVVVAPWTLRNWVVYHRFIPVSTGAATHLWRGHNSLSYGDAWDRWLTPGDDLWRQRAQALPEPLRSEALQEGDQLKSAIEKRMSELNDLFLASDEILGPLARQHIRDHPIAAACRSLRRLGIMFTASFMETGSQNIHTSSRNKLFAALSYYPIALLAVMGLFLPDARRRRLLIIYLPVLTAAIMYAVSVVSTRYRLMLDPFILLFAAATLAHCFRHLRVFRCDPPAQTTEP